MDSHSISSQKALTETDVNNLGVSDEASFHERYDKLALTVTRHPLNRDLLYETLVFCAEERTLQEAEAHIAAQPAFKSATQNQYAMLSALVRAGGLTLIERDESGAEVTEADKEGLTEDEIDDLVAAVSYISTDVARSFVEENRPRARLVDLLALDPARNDTYIELLEFVAAAPRSYGEVESLLKGRPVLETIIDGTHETMQPSVFVDKLERAGALAWNKGWTLTREGEDFLTDLKATKH